MGGILYKQTIYKQWGFAHKDTEQTIQGINYTDCDAMSYGDAWLVPNVTLSWKNVKNMYFTDISYPTTLSPDQTAMQALARTFNKEHSYEEFVLGVSRALQAGLVAMAADGCTVVALIASVNCGIYAPPEFRSRINAEFMAVTL